MNLSKSFSKLKKEDLDINLPPNFDIYADQTEDKEEDYLVFEDYPRLGETNPQTNPSKKSNAINFTAKEMEKYDLDKMLNPHENDLDIMGRELQNYREQVKVQNQEVKKLEEMKKSMIEQSFSMHQPQPQYQVRQETKMYSQAPPPQNLHYTRIINQEDNFFDKPVPVQIQNQPERVIRVQEGNFFDKPKVVVQKDNNYSQSIYLNQNPQPVQRVVKQVRYTNMSQHNPPTQIYTNQYKY